MKGRSLDVGWDLGQTGVPATLGSEVAREQGLTHVGEASWPCNGNPLAEEHAEVVASHLMEGQVTALFRLGTSDSGAADYALAVARISNGTAHCTAYSRSPMVSSDAIEQVEKIIGRAPQDDPATIPIRFWAYGPHGPEYHRRELDAPNWEDIEENYAARTVEALKRLMVPEFRPANSGQLLLWSGRPGTGKTTAIRALAQCWRGFADFDYVTDPDKFFGERADYMLRVMLGQEDEDGDRWRVLILEDSGELIQPDAKQAQGQALSRFLNAVDGLIGQGLRVMTLLTTNEEFNAGHEAVTRAGRAAAQIEFDTLSPEESMRWLERMDPELTVGAADSHTLADLYAMIEGHERQREKAGIGFGRG